MSYLKRNDTDELIYKQKQTHKLKEQIYGCWQVRVGQMDSQGVWNQHIHTAEFKMDKQQGPTVQHRELCSMLCGSLDGRGVWGRMDTCIYKAEALCCEPETVSTLLIEYSPKSNKKFKKINLCENLDKVVMTMEESPLPASPAENTSPLAQDKG